MKPLPDCFPFPLVLGSIHDASGRRVPRKAVVEALFRFRSRVKGLGVVDVPPGFDTDFASVPRALWAVYPPDGEYTEAAVIHDWLYWEQPCSRAQADAAFLEGMAALGIPWHRRRILYTAVWSFGWIAWGRNGKKRTAKESHEG